MKQCDIFVLDKCEITVDKKNILWTVLHNFEKVKKCYFVHRSPLSCRSGCPHTAMIILSSIVVSDSLRSLRRNHVTTRASSWLVNAARIFAKVQIFQLARFEQITRYARQTPETLNSRRLIRVNRLIRANHAAGCLFASLHWLNM